MRLSALFVRLAVFLVAAIGCGIGAQAVVATVEQRSVEAVQSALIDSGYEFASVLGDGLQVILEGEAESEAKRFRALSTAGHMVDASRVIDNMTIKVSEAIEAPEFSMEILRNDSGISVIGLVPLSSDTEALTTTLADMAGRDGNFADFLESADYDVPEGWNSAVTYALRSLRQMPRSKVSVRAGRVEIEAITDSPEQKEALETRLRQSAPRGLRVVLDILAPRPVVSPFVTRFVIDDDGARFESCVADTPDAERRIIAAARAAGAEGVLTCTQALGAPTVRWADAVVMGIEAVHELGAGTLTISDADMTFVAKPGEVAGNFDRIAGELENDLPEVFALDAILPEVPSATDGGPPQFIATLSPEGLVQLRGRVSDDRLNTTAENFARAKFGSADISMATRVVDGLPGGWPMRVLAGIEALSKLSNGSVTVEPDMIAIRGNTGVQEADAEISGILIEKLGTTAKFEVDVTYVEALDPIAALPTEEECLANIEIVTEARKITFEPASATIAGAGAAILDDIAEILQKCRDLEIEIAGYTDSQGSEEGNQRLSQQRANAVLDGLRVRRVPVSNFKAVGYGEANPIADNSTEEGREANRRIEFSLIEPEPTEEEQTALEEMEAGAGAGAAEEGEAGDTEAEDGDADTAEDAGGDAAQEDAAEEDGATE
ncbi:OmpA family protein [Thalassorhabdomicrobium marinisediminis]|uniref:OmpA-like domain-containing protein n=1 Tax=Thalassorhabdomicrobium marinisediminis TaxID=2170577 RepID=A0A2T7FYT0_9RHOB|nr:OmpA family protein [Thalassorhabdomicrobium marinisediminis]PVA07324.1 hypothetical protein DC363_05625 [Thalassorhabdomicrobium marinisediminis]